MNKPQIRGNAKKSYCTDRATFIQAGNIGKNPIETIKKRIASKTGENKPAKQINIY